MLNSFVQKLRHGADLTVDDETVLADLVRTVRRVGAREDLVSGHPTSRALIVVLEGWACRYRLLESGKRQIISLLLPGDLSEPFGVRPHFINDTLGAITPVTFSMIPLDAIRSLVRSRQSVEEALWWDLLANSVIEREHIISLGRRMAAERLGHLFCELHLRLTLTGHVQACRFDMPLTQADLADMLGLSTVHINRSLQDLRAAGLVSLHNRQLTIRDLDRLRLLAQFDPAFLPLRRVHAA